MFTRKLHRWLAAGAMIFIAYVVLTGTVVALQELVNPASFGAGAGQGGAPEPLTATSSPLPPIDQAERMAARAVSVALAASPDASLGKVVIVMRVRDGRTEARVTFGSGPTASAVLVDADRGVVLRANDDHGTKLNNLLQEVHSGALYGKGGRVLVLMTGAALLSLCVTGALVYFDLYGRRRRLDKPNPFWS